MNPTPPWYRVASDRSVLRRATISALGVGTILTAVTQGDRITAGTLPSSALLQIALTYVVPFVVSLVSSVVAVRVERRGGAAAIELLEREIQAIDRFPGQNPNQVMRIAPDGALGMHAGPAIAGVIGLKKFIYDVWGDTINTASRMETTGVPGRLQVTRETCARLGDDFEFERRGIVDVKGKGPIETWFVLGRRGSGAETGAQVAAAARADR